MLKLYWLIKDWLGNRPFVLGGRSSQWRTLRNHFIKDNPYCFCGKKAKVVHHVVPVSVDKSKELEWSNLLSVCRHCHLRFAHLGNYRSYNIIIKTDAEYWKWKRRNRP